MPGWVGALCEPLLLPILLQGAVAEAPGRGVCVCVRRQSEIIMSFWDNVHARFNEDRFNSIALRVFTDAKSCLSQNPKCFSLTCMVSYPPALRLPGQLWRCILGLGARFAVGTSSSNVDS
eukprot:365743-Chlamydomonas_euryale.AAC.2